MHFSALQKITAPSVATGAHEEPGTRLPIAGFVAIKLAKSNLQTSTAASPAGGSLDEAHF
jgi:hypothetical protein